MKLFETVSYHLWKPCNMQCTFCYATFEDIPKDVLPKGHQTKEECMKMIEELASHGVKKITFAGGEPMLCPWLTELLQHAKNQGVVTSIITNGTKLTKDWLDKNARYLDWLGVSVDTLDRNTMIASGRHVSQNTVNIYDLAGVLNYARMLGLKIKINTVVHAYNHNEYLHDFLKAVKPDRWKVFQVLKVEGQNDYADDMYIEKSHFDNFLEHHKQFNPVAEDNEVMRSSYMLIDPAGRFFDDATGKHKYSDPIAKVGIEEAFGQLGMKKTNFLKRGGIYKW